MIDNEHSADEGHDTIEDNPMEEDEIQDRTKEVAMR
jgi:hypothetical protein